MPFSTNELNRDADYKVAGTLSCRLHTGDPGANGVNNRIGNLSQNLAAATWSNAANGDVQYNADVNFGVVDSNNDQNVSHYSIWRSNSFVGSESFVNVIAVIAGGTFRINTGTIAFNGSTS